MLLAIERSSAVASAAVFDGDGRRLAGVSSATPGQGDAWPLVRETLARAGAAAADLDAFAVGVGPGSFSGIRAALALAQGLAAPRGIPVRGVSSAAAAVRAWRGAHPATPRARLFGDARRGEVWVFDEPADPSALAHSAADLRLVSPETALAEARDPAFSALAADPARLARLLPGAALEPALPTAEDVAALFLAGFSGPADPVYVHPAVVGAAVSAV